MSQVIAMRKQYKDEVLDKQGVKLGFMGPVARASAMALNQIPAVNAAIENDDTIVFRDYVDLSIAVANPKGLVTPVLRNIERKSVVGIEQGIAELGKKVCRTRASCWVLIDLYIVTMSRLATAN